MKKISYFLVSMLAAAMTLTGCHHDDPTPTPAGGSFKSSDIIAAVCDFYSTWEEERAIPTTVKIGSQDAPIAAFAYAEAAELVALANGKAADVTVPEIKMASNPDRDSYDQAEIAVTNGPKDGKGVAEDIATLAQAFLADADAKGQIPNQTLVYRGSDAIAFCTNRMIVTVARAISEYAAANAFPAKVSTEYLSASNTLKAFAQEFVNTYLPIWENTICNSLSADASHNSGNGTAWECVHIIPIPYDTPNDYKNEGKDQYDFAQVGNPKNIEVNGETYTAAQCWEIAIRGLMDMCTTDGQAFLNTMARNTPINFGDGKSLMSAPISKPSEACIWGKYPWYESERDGGVVKLNGEPITECNVDLILKCGSWHVTRSFIANANNDPLGMIGNFQVFGTDEAASIVYNGYEGLISPMREFVIMLRIYKYILDNNINKNVYSAIKDVKFDYDFYAQVLPMTFEETSLTFEAMGSEAQAINFEASDAWTVESDSEWISLDKSGGNAGSASVSVTVADYTESDNRTGNITFTCGNYKKVISVTQKAYVAPTTGTLKAFAIEFVKALDVWNATVGRVDSEGKHNGATGWENVHLIPIDNPNATYVGAGYEGNQYDRNTFPTPFEITVEGTTYTAAQCWEIAQRGMLDLVTLEGAAELENFNDTRNHVMTLGNGKTLGMPIPAYTAGCQWGANPWYEENSQMTNNGEPVTEVGMDFIVKVGAWHVVRSFIKTSINSPLGTIGNFQQFGTTDSTLMLDGYVGLIAPMREFLILARFYKYLLDNNIDSNIYDAVKDVKFDYDLYNQGGAAQEPTNTIKAFAKEYVKLLDVWAETTGTVAQGDYNEFNFDHEDVHYIPMDATIKVGETTYDISDCLEIAMRSFMLLMGEDGNATNVHGTSSGVSNFPALTTPATMSTEVPVSHHMAISKWYNETPGNGGPIRYNGEANKVNSTILLNYCERNVNWVVKQGNDAWANVCGYNGNGNFPNHPEFSGCLIPARGQMACLHAFKMLLDNNINENVKEYFDGKIIECTLWGNEAYD